MQLGSSQRPGRPRWRSSLPPSQPIPFPCPALQESKAALTKLSSVVTLLERGADPTLVHSCADSIAVTANLAAGQAFFDAVVQAVERQPGGIRGCKPDDINAALDGQLEFIKGRYKAVTGACRSTRGGRQASVPGLP